MNFGLIDKTIREQVRSARDIIQKNIGKQLISIHLYGSTYWRN